VASFTATVATQTASFNAAGSTDADGTIAAYVWDFGDGASGAGASPSHAYAAAGSFNVTLTVTDDAGATGSITKSVTVTAPTTLLGSDDFERTVASGWGTAPIGGAWSGTAGTAAGVSGGTGRLTMSTAGAGPNEFLVGPSSSDTDVQFSLSLDKVPVGGTSGFYENVYLRRVAGQGDYRAIVKILPGGAVSVSLSWATVGGTATTLATQTVSGLTFAAGNTLVIRAQATGTAPTVLRAKVWRSSVAEPSTWNLSTTNAQAGLQAPGGIGMQSYLSSATTNFPIVARHDDLRWRPAGP
jgi:PKD repeat protein